MNDPSQAILSLAFIATLLLAIAAIAAQAWVRRHQQVPPALPLGKVQVWFYRQGDLIGAAVVYFFFAGLFWLSCLAPPMEASDFTVGALLVSLVFQLMLAGGVTAAVMRVSKPNQWLGLRWKGWPWLFLIGPGAVIIMLALFWGIQVSGYMEWMESLGVETIQETVTILQESQDPVMLGLLIFMAVIIAPICEEVVFRGYLHPILKKFGGVWAAAFCSSLLFSIAHGNLAVMLPLFLLGALLVWLYEVTGSIWTPIAVHFCFNATTVIAQMAARHMDLQAALISLLPNSP